MLTTISLSNWMSGRWAFALAGGQDVVSRKTNSWSQEVEDVYNYNSTTNNHNACHGHDGDTESVREWQKNCVIRYLENASAIAFLLLEQIVTIENETSGNGSAIAIAMENITVTIEVNRGEEAPETLNQNEDKDARLTGAHALIKFVNVTLHNNPQQEQGSTSSSLFQSLGAILLHLFTRQEILSDWGTHPCEFNELSMSGEGGDDSAEFESAMLKALFILDGNNDPRNNNNEGEGEEAQPVPRQKQPRRHNNMESKTFSRLRDEYAALPASICRLISDLIDEPSRTKTSYVSLNDVLDDLKQMVVQPNIFLHEREPLLGLPFFKPALDFGNKLYGRKEEVSQLIHIANGVSSKRETGPLEVVRICGYSGCGKSFLVSQVGRYLSSNNNKEAQGQWIFVQGKFDRMRQNDAFSVVTSAFESYCQRVQEIKIQGDQNQSDLEYCSRVSTAVMDALGRAGVEYLSQIIPSLKRIIDLDSSSSLPSTTTSSNNNGEISTSNGGAIISNSSTIINRGFDLGPIQSADDALMSQRKREYTLCAFVEAILSVGRPLLLFYDDLQWADASALEFLHKLIKHLADRNEPRKNILFVQAFRDNEVGDAELCVASSIESYGSVNITKIKLDGFSKKVLNDIISPLLCLPCRITSPLSELIHQKTMGNIFFVIEFMKILESPDKKIMTFSLAKRRWIWDIDSIAVMTISDSVAGLLVKKLLSIEKTMLNSLIIASCFGSQVNKSVMELLNGMKGVNDMVKSFDATVDEGLLEKAGPLFMFAHDSIQQSVYELIPKNELIKLHVDIGLVLISKGGYASREMIDEIFAFAVSHINMALPECATISADTAIEFTSSQRIVFAKLNLRAGQKAVGKSDFSLAQVHLKAGMSFLPQNSWTDQYDLTLQMFDEYANVLFVRRSLDELHSHIDIILKNATCISDKMKAHELLIAALTLKGSTSEALEHAKSVLDSLGFPFPSTINSETVTGVVTSLSSSLMTLTPDKLRAFPLMTEKIPLQAMRIMCAVHMPYSFSSPIIFQMMACQMMQLIIKHGLCVESAEAFATFGYCVNTLLYNFEVGYRMGKLSLVVLERFKATNRVAKLYFIIYGFLSIWKEPLQASIEGLKSAVNTGLLEGDFQNTFLIRGILNRQMYLAGCNLSEIRDKCFSLCRDMMYYDKSRKIYTSGFNPQLGDLYSMMALTGESEDEVYSILGFSREQNEELLLKQYSATNNAPFAQIVYFHRLTNCFWFRDYEAALGWCEKYESFTERHKLLRVIDILKEVIHALSSLILSRRKKQRALIVTGKEILLKMQQWAKAGSKWNAENKALLMEAEYYFANGDTAKAKIAYEQSIQSAHEHKFIHEEALAHELYGIFCVEQGDSFKGNELLGSAKDLYEQWGAQKKADNIFPL